MEINHLTQPSSNLGFKGYQHKKNDVGTKSYDFNYLYDSKNWDCEVEFFNVKKNPENHTYSVAKENGKMEPFLRKALTPQGAVVDDEEFNLNNPNAPVAYRYRLTPKNNEDYHEYAKDDAASICGDGCNFLNRKATTVTKQGPMYLALPDAFAPGYVYAGFQDKNTGEIIKPGQNPDVSKFDRTFSNKAGGTLAGLEAKVPELRKTGYKRLITTPILGGDDVSSHYYWMKKMFQTAGPLGNIDNFKSLQKTLFKNGMNYVNDGAYTSQGIEGVNFQYALRWMRQDDKPQEYYMFRMQGLQNEALGLGLVPKNMENLRHKVVNAPHKYETQSNGQIKITKNEKYDPSQSTYIQIYDDSLVSDEQRNDNTKLIDVYAKSNSEKDGKVNRLGINNHDDTNIPNKFKIDPREYDANVNNFNILNKSADKKIGLNTPQGTMILGSFSGFKITPKDEGGFVTWDANTDIAKVSYTASDYDTNLLENIKNPKEKDIEYKKLDQAHSANRDVLVNGMKYWTRLVRNENTEYTAKTLGKVGNSSEEVVNKINSLVYDPKNKQLPEDVVIDNNVAENIMANDYELRPKESDYQTSLNSSLMELPLDSLEFADDTVGALSSPYLSKRSPDLKHVGQSRYEAMNDETYKVPEKYTHTYNKMNGVFTNQISKFADNILKNVDQHSDEKIFGNDGNLTEYGQYVVPMVAGDIAKYAIIKSLVPSAEVKPLKDGNLTYDYKKLGKEATLEKLGINGESPEDEANQLADKIKHGVSNFSSGDVSLVVRSIHKRLEGTNAKSFRFAEAMVDRSGLGLDHRIDAAKDVADMDAIRNKTDNFDHQFDEIINIWKPAISAVKKENPNSYVVAEFTDFGKLLNATYGTEDNIKSKNPKAKYNGANDAIVKILNETGMNTEANYSHFFTDLYTTFGKNFETGVVTGDNAGRAGQLDGALNRFSEMPLDYQRNAYTFGGNHDKPRMAECYGMDMGLFHDDYLASPGDGERLQHRETAYMVMNDILNQTEISKDGWDKINNSETYFNNVSSKAVAKADWIRSSVGIANELVRQKRISEIDNDGSIQNKDEAKKQVNEKASKTYAAFSKSIKDVVNGNYYLNGEDDNFSKKAPDSLKKQTEKDGFGSKDINTAFAIVKDHAEAKYGLGNVLNNEKEQKEYSNLVEKIAIGIPTSKVRMFSKFLSGLPGNPTTYYGDEFGMTGYEEKCHNVYLQNRNPIDWSAIDNSNENKKDYVIKHKVIMDGIVSSRRDDYDNKSEALNNGTMFKLQMQYDNRQNGNKCPAILSQAADGSMNISVFNANNISVEGQLKNVDLTDANLKIDEIMNPKPAEVVLDKITLQGKNDLSKIDLPDGVQFKNFDDTDPAVYETFHDENGTPSIHRKINGKYESICINSDTAKEGLLRLYYQPDEVKQTAENKKQMAVSFKGLKQSREYFNPTYNIGVTNPYSAPKNKALGSNLSIVSK